MKRHIFAKLQEWKARVTQGDDQSGPLGDTDQQLTENLAKEEMIYQQHFEQAYNDWQTLAPERKEKEWRLECQKAFAEEYDRHQDTQDRLDQLEQEIHHLRKRLNAEKDGHSSSSSIEASWIPLRRTTMKSFSAQQARDLQYWDYDRLLDKWKQRVRQQRSVQHPLPTVDSWSPRNRPMNGASSAFEQRQPNDSHLYHNEGETEMEDEDLADAPGEDEDDDLTTTVAAHKGMMTRDVLDPTLRPGSDSVGDGGRILMGLKGFQGINGDGNI